MLTFWALAAVMIVLAVVSLIFPFVITSKREDNDQRTLNIRLFKERLSELEAGLDDASLSSEEFDALKLELQQSLLQDAEGATTQARTTPGTKSLMFGAVVAVPLLVFAIYQQLGGLADWQLSQAIEQVYQQEAQPDQKSVQTLLQLLEQRLLDLPDHNDYRFLLARMQFDQGEFASAAENFQLISQRYPDDAELLAYYARARYRVADGVMTPQIQGLFDRVLSIDPQQKTLLSILGMHYFQNGDYRKAIDSWEKLLSNFEQNTPAVEMVRRSIKEARLRLVASQGSVDQTVSVAEHKPELDVHVTLSEQLTLPAEGVLFVFAKAAQGSPVPLAVVKLPIDQLPARVLLNDSLAMAPNLTLSSFDKVVVTARLSLRGDVVRASGDIEGHSEVLELAAGVQVVKLVLDQLVN